MKIKHAFKKGHNAVLLAKNLLFSQQRLLRSVKDCSSNCGYFSLISRLMSNKLLYQRETGTLEEICKVSTTFLLVNENNIYPTMTIRNKRGLRRSWRKL
jgi:hypothetical protein